MRKGGRELEGAMIVRKPVGGDEDDIGVEGNLGDEDAHSRVITSNL